MLSSIRKCMGTELPTILHGLKAAEKVADATQVPFLTGILGLAVHIVETAQKIKGGKMDCMRLAQHAGNLALALRDEMPQLERGSSSLQRRQERLFEAFMDIDVFMKKQASRKWIDRFKNQDEIQASIKEYGTRLDDATRTLGITSLISIEKRLIEMNQLSTHLLTGQNNLERGLLHIGSPSNRDGGVRVCWKDDILLRRPLRTVPSNLIPEDYEAEFNGQVAVVRYYQGDDKRFQNDLACLKSLWHPNVQQLVGRSHAHSDHKFLVVRSGTHDALNYSRTASGIQRLLLLAQMMLQFHVNFWSDTVFHNLTRVQSAVEYLNRQTGWELWMTECDILVDQSGQVFLDPSELERDRMENSTRPSFVRRLLGDEWSYGALTMYESDPAEAWMVLAHCLQDYLANEVLPYSRQNLLWRLAKALSVTSVLWVDPKLLRRGDVGLETTNGQLSIVTNISESLGVSAAQKKCAEERVEHGVDHSLTSTKRGRYIRHTFRVLPHQERLKFERRVQSRLINRQAAWYALAQNARTIAKDQGVAPHDLLLVTRSYDTYTAEYWFDEHGPWPEKVYFFEGPLNGEQRWGHWSTEEEDWKPRFSTDELRHNPPYSESIFLSGDRQTMHTRLRWRCWVDYVKLTKDLCLFLEEVETRSGPLPHPPEAVYRQVAENTLPCRIMREFWTFSRKMPADETAVADGGYTATGEASVNL